MSARPPQAIEPITQALGVPEPVTSFGGALIEDGKKRLFDRRLPVNASRTVIELAQQAGISLSFYRNRDWLVTQEDFWSRAEGEITGLHPTVLPLAAALADGAPHKLLCMGEKAEIDRFLHILQSKMLSVSLLRSKDTYLEILPKNADKADALRTLCQLLHISPRQTMAIGDHDVDCTLLRAAGVGVAMGNCSPAARQATDWIAPDNNHAGVAATIYHWIKEENA